MGGALFEVLRDFYGTDNLNYVLHSAEDMPSGLETRSFTSFTQAEWENGMSRIYMGVHWIFDAEDGIKLGNDIADWVSANGSTMASTTAIGQTLAHDTPDRLPTSHWVAAVAWVI